MPHIFLKHTHTHTRSNTQPEQQKVAQTAWHHMISSLKHSGLKHRPAETRRAQTQEQGERETLLPFKHLFLKSNRRTCKQLKQQFSDLIFFIVWMLSQLPASANFQLFYPFRLWNIRLVQKKGAKSVKTLYFSFKFHKYKCELL